MGGSLFASDLHMKGVTTHHMSSHLVIFLPAAPCVPICPEHLAGNFRRCYLSHFTFRPLCVDSEPGILFRSPLCPRMVTMVYLYYCTQC